MLITQRLYKTAENIWQDYLKHPFVKGIGDGTLDIEKFRFFMVQDYLYLLDYAKVFALGVVKANDEYTMRKFATLVSGTLNNEMSIHKKYMERLGITKAEIESSKPSIYNTSYTNYMLWAADREGILELATAVLACSWSYKVIGDFLNKIPNASEHEFYGEWIQGYSSEEYAADNDEIISLVNNIGKNASEEQIKNLENIFINCSRYESAFWDMAWNMSM